MGAPKDGKWQDSAADNGTQPSYYSKIQVKMERPTAAKGKNTFRKISGHRESLRSIH